MRRCTSKAAFIAETESGNIDSQANNIFELMSIGGTFSMREILAIYRGRYHDIEYTSISRACKNLKDQGRIFEVGTRKCSVTNVTINELSVKNCLHNKYRGDNWMSAPAALKNTNIAWMGMVVKTCEDCGMDISKFQRVQVKTAEQCLREMNL